MFETAYDPVPDEQALPDLDEMLMARNDEIHISSPEERLNDDVHPMLQQNFVQLPWNESMCTPTLEEADKQSSQQDEQPLEAQPPTTVQDLSEPESEAAPATQTSNLGDQFPGLSASPTQPVQPPTTRTLRDEYDTEYQEAFDEQFKSRNEPETVPEHRNTAPSDSSSSEIDPHQETPPLDSFPQRNNLSEGGEEKDDATSENEKFPSDPLQESQGIVSGGRERVESQAPAISEQS